jgi:steroid delta-isomerase-like uncharacterized protein
MPIINRRTAFISPCVGLMFAGAATRSATAADKSLGQKWVDGWNSANPELLVAAFTSDGIYEDVPFGLKKKGSAELRELHKFFHDAVGGLHTRLINSHVADGHGTIEWMFGGKDIAVYKTGKPFEVQGVSVIEVRAGRISRNLDYYDAATIMKQVGALPAP